MPTSTATTTYDFGCLMVNLHVPTWEALVGRIPEEELYQPGSRKFGRVSEPHCTILFGFHDYPGLGAELMRTLPVQLPALTAPDGLYATGCDFFANPKYDVLKLTMKSVELTRLNAWCKGRYAYTSDFPDYEAHATLAYCQPGAGAKYRTLNNMRLPLRVKSLVYTPPCSGGEKQTRVL